MAAVEHQIRTHATAGGWVARCEVHGWEGPEHARKGDACADAGAHAVEEFDKVQSNLQTALDALDRGVSEHLLFGAMTEALSAEMLAECIKHAEAQS